MTFSKEYTPSEFFDLLNEYGKAVKNGNYKKTIPYDIWKKLRKVNETVKVVVYPTANIAVSIYEDIECLYCEGVEDDGFASFFCCEKCKCEEKDDMTTNDVLKVTIDGTVSAAKIEPVRLEPGTIMFNIDGGGVVDDCWTGEKKTQKLEDLLDNLNTRIDELVEKLNGKADIDIYGDLNNYIVQNANDINRLANRLEAKTFENRDEINHLENCVDELNTDLSTLAANLCTANDAIGTLEKEFINFVREFEEKENKKKVKNKENNTMKNFNFDFGPCTNDNVRMSMYGLAVKNTAGTYVSLNPSTREVIDVDIFNFEGGKYLFKMPVAIKDIAVGDVIIHNKKPMFVEGFSPLGDIMAIDPVAGERKEVMLTRSPFGFNYATKVVNLFGAGGMATPNADNPFGNMLPFVLMNEEDGDIDPMMLMFMMNQNGNANASAFGNPMMMYFLMKDKGEIDPMMMFMMMNQQQPHTCHCENKCAQA
jgi:hypothetical protein